MYLSADTCKRNRKTSSLSDFSQSPHGRDHIAHNENTSPVVHKHHNVIPFTGQCGRESLARTTSVAQVYSSSPWFSWAVKSLSGWHEESVRCGVLCHCHAHSCCQQHSQETFIVQTVWRWKRLNGDIHPMRLFGIQTDWKISICIALNSPLVSQPWRIISKKLKIEACWILLRFSSFSPFEKTTTTTNSFSKEWCFPAAAAITAAANLYVKQWVISVQTRLVVSDTQPHIELLLALPRLIDWHSQQCMRALLFYLHKVQEMFFCF